MSLEVTPTLLVHLTLNGLVLGTLFFLTASGLSLIFGLMHVLNLAHAALFTWGAYVAMTVFKATGGSFALAIVAGVAAGGVLSGLIELFIRPLYGKPLLQILLTLGLYMVLHEALRAVWGPNLLGFPLPEWLSGRVRILGQSFPHYRLFVLALGAAVFAAVYATLLRTRFGVIVRAGVENSEMVEALGVNIRRVFAGVFVLGGSLAALGGAAAGPFFRTVWPDMGFEVLVPAFIVVVIGGLGSFTGSAVGSLFVGLSQTYVGYFYPPAALIVNVALLALVLLIRPQGLFSPGR